MSRDVTRAQPFVLSFNRLQLLLSFLLQNLYIFKLGSWWNYLFKLSNNIGFYVWSFFFLNFNKAHSVVLASEIKSTLQFDELKDLTGDMLCDVIRA